MVNFGPNSKLESIGEYAFYYCDISSITIPDSVTSIGNGAFYNCENLQSIYYDGTIADWCRVDNSTSPLSYTENFYIKKNDSWQKLTDITDIEIPDGVTKIGDGAFYHCSNLTSITIPDSVTSIGGNAFYNCTNLATVNIEANSKLESIGYGAFSGCSNLTSITIPSSLKGINGTIFKDCKELQYIYYNGTIADWCEMFNIYGTAMNSYVEKVYIKEKGTWQKVADITDIEIPDGVTKISGYTFSGFNSLTSVTIPDSVTSIGDGAFCGTNLATVNIGANSKLECIGEYAFEFCHNLTSITIPDSVTSIGYGAFEWCSSLTSIFIPKSVADMGNKVFNGCDNLTIYCEAAEQPSGWDSEWSSSDYRRDYLSVVWGATRDSVK